MNYFLILLGALFISAPTMATTNWSCTTNGDAIEAVSVNFMKSTENPSNFTLKATVEDWTEDENGGRSTYTHLVPVSDILPEELERFKSKQGVPVSLELDPEHQPEGEGSYIYGGAIFKGAVLMSVPGTFDPTTNKVQALLAYDGNVYFLYCQN